MYNYSDFVLSSRELYNNNDVLPYIIISYTLFIIYVFSFSNFFFYVNEDPQPHARAQPQPRDYKKLYDEVKDDPVFSSSAAEPAAAAAAAEEEELWKTRILMLYDKKRGMVIMNYDLYKEAFSYYCDTYIPYDELNEIARRYAITYRCISFFVPDDATVVAAAPAAGAPAPPPKPFKIGEIAAAAAAAPATAYSQKKSAAAADPPAPEKLINRFVRAGKIADFKVLKQPPKKVEVKNVSYSYYKSLFC
jgi:hypothetical protein